MFKIKKSLKKSVKKSKRTIAVAALIAVIVIGILASGLGARLLSAIGITGKVVYTDTCSASENGLDFEYLNYSVQNDSATLSFRITNNNDEDLDYSAFEVIGKALSPADESYYETNNNVYEVKNPSGNPFKSIKFEFERCAAEDNFTDCIPGDVCPRLDKAVSLVELQSLSSGKKSTNDILKDAVKHLQKSLLGKNPMWIDSNHVSCKYGTKVFDEEKKTVEKLIKIIDPSKAEYDASIALEVDYMIESIVAADKKIAMTMIDEANASQFILNKNEFLAAIEELNRGVERYNVAKYNEAIEHYKKSWQHAQKAVYSASCNFVIPDENITECYGACPLTEKISSLTVLRGLASSNADTQKAILDASKHLQKSLVGKKTKWLDEIHIACKGGNKVFDEEKKAVKKLMKIADPAEEEYDAALAAAAISLSVRLSDIDRKIAATLLGEINVSTPKDAQEYAKAIEELGKGDAEYSLANYEHAIDHYKKSWQHSKKATYDGSSGDYCDFNFEEECSFKNGDSGIFTYQLSLADFTSLKNITVQAKADKISGKVIFKNPCGFQPPFCGNGICEPGEDSFNCPIDCPVPPFCGNGICEPGENITCPVDCVNISVSIISPKTGSNFKVNDTILFSAYASNISTITSYEWLSSLDGLFGSSMTFNYSGLRIGWHNITAIVTDSNSLTSQDIIQIRIQPVSAPTASIVSPASGKVFKQGSLIAFSGTASDSDGTIVSYSWESDQDGILGTEAYIEISSLSTGKHKITFTATDNDGLTSSYSIEIKISALTAPAVSILSPVDQADYKIGQNITFVGVGSDYGGSIVSYLWTSSINGVIGTSDLFTASGLSTGLHTITLTATDDDGLATSDSVQITVKPGQAPTASIVLPNNGDVFKQGEIIYFVGDGSDPDGNIVSWIWSSNLDGIIGNTQTFSKDDLSIGRHDITLTVVDDDAQKFVDTFTIWILVNSVPSPDVTIISPIDNSVIKEETGIFFDANVTGNITSYEWSSNIDGVLSNSLSFTGNLSVGRHTISLIAKDENNLTSLDVITLSIVPKTSPNVTITSPTGIEFSKGDVIDFSADISDDGTIASIIWNSNLDGNFGSTASFDTSSLTVGEHLITLIVTDNDGLTTTVQKTIRIIAPSYGGSGGGGGGGGGRIICTPSWICTDWTECSAGIQTRTCTDANRCGTMTGMPETSRTCTPTLELPAPELPEEKPAPELPTAPAEKTCRLLGIDLGFWWIICWYWWLLLLLLLLLLRFIYWLLIAPIPFFQHPHICPRCHVKMRYHGRIKAGVSGGLRSSYVCPKCGYKALMGEHLHDGGTNPASHAHECPRCGKRMRKGGTLKEGPRHGMRRIYICPGCKYKSMFDEGLSAREITRITQKSRKKSKK
jgi:hypothetical protein